MKRDPRFELPASWPHNPRIIPQADCPERRVETGPLKFGDDWCGYFFRGDNAMFEAMRLDEIAETPGMKASDRAYLRDLACGFRQADEMQWPVDAPLTPIAERDSDEA